MKICGTCKQSKPTSCFHIKNKAKNTYQSKCKDCHSAYLKNHYKSNPRSYLDSKIKRRKKYIKWLQEIKNVPCFDCGVQYPFYVMDLDHVEDKKIPISAIRNGDVGRNNATQELAKCEVVYSNCHRIRTYKRLRI